MDYYLKHQELVTNFVISRKNQNITQFPHVKKGYFSDFPQLFEKIATFCTKKVINFVENKIVSFTKMIELFAHISEVLRYNIIYE